MNKHLYIIVIAIISFALTSCRTSRQPSENETQIHYQIIETNLDGKGNALEIIFEKGPEHNHPLMAIWLEDTTGKYIQTLYVAKSIATSTFNFGEVNKGKWMPGVIKRPASLPYWAHKRGIKEDDGTYLPSANNPIPDAYSGATPEADFILKTRSDKPLPQSVKVCFEINQSWDWNDYWTNAKFPDDKEYKTSSQPALVYEVMVDLSNKNMVYSLNVIGHSHYSGQNGELFRDISSITSALRIASSIKVKVL
jgi:hypothetical protein